MKEIYVRNTRNNSHRFILSQTSLKAIHFPGRLIVTGNVASAELHGPRRECLPKAFASITTSSVLPNLHVFNGIMQWLPDSPCKRAEKKSKKRYTNE